MKTAIMILALAVLSQSVRANQTQCDIDNNLALIVDYNNCVGCQAQIRIEDDHFTKIAKLAGEVKVAHDGPVSWGMAKLSKMIIHTELGDVSLRLMKDGKYKLANKSTIAGIPVGVSIASCRDLQPVGPAVSGSN